MRGFRLHYEVASRATGRHHYHGRYIRDVSVRVRCTCMNKTFCPGHVEVKALNRHYIPPACLRRRLEKTIARTHHLQGDS